MRLKNLQNLGYKDQFRIRIQIVLIVEYSIYAVDDIPDNTGDDHTSDSAVVSEATAVVSESDQDIADQNAIEQDLITTNTEVHSPAVAINIEGGSNNTYNVQFDQHIYGKRVRKANTMHGSLKKGKYSS